jgi:putative endonuclease
MPHMYILKCADGSYYTGSTWNLTRRIAEHSAGLGANYTQKRRPVTLAYSEEFSRIDEAYYREKQIQNWSHAKKQSLVEGKLGELRSKAKKDFTRRKRAS